MQIKIKIKYKVSFSHYFFFQFFCIWSNLAVTIGARGHAACPNISLCNGFERRDIAIIFQGNSRDIASDLPV